MDEHTAIEKRIYVEDIDVSFSKMKLKMMHDPMFKTPSKDKNEGRQLAEEK